MVATLRDSLKTIEDYKSAHPHYTELLDIMADILILREEYLKNLKDSIFDVEENLIYQKMNGGLPLVDLTAKKYDLKRPKEYFNSLVCITGKRMPEVAKSILDVVNDPQFEWDKCICTSFNSRFEETKDKEAQTDHDDEESINLIDFLLEESLRPELEIIARKYGEIVEKSGWSEGYCPICGKEPKIGEIREDENGKRYLFCHQCGFKWNFNRIKCPFCGNDEQHSLAYFEVEGDERYRIDVCNKCWRYIKTVELPKSCEEPNMDVEDIATLHLDMIAYDEGYN
ncbi:MAG: formate dehydrogenase accessory protein FdhE [Syntrophaceae bacterium]|nr:formate dehydrogenase accessory protein FdhE [Syntrophaceae bacterium]